MDQKLESELNELAHACRALAMEGHEDFTLGHASLRDPEGRGIWMKRRGIGLGEVMDAGDFVLIGFDGTKLAGDGRSHSEWPIHTEAMRARPDIRVCAHTHPEYATLVTAIDSPLKLVTQDGLRIRGQRAAYFEGKADLIQTQEEGVEVAQALGAAWVLFMRNHGITFFAGSVWELALTGVFVERASRAFIRLLATGAAIVEPDARELTRLAKASDSPSFVEDNWRYLMRKLEQHEKTSR